VVADRTVNEVLAAILRKYAIVIGLASIAIVLAFGSRHFLTGINLLNTVESGAIYGIVAVGLTVLMIGGEFDLCAGATFVLSGIVAARLQPVMGSWPALAAGLLAGAAVGILNGLFVSRFSVSSFVTTLASSMIIVGIGTLVTGGFQLYVPDEHFGLIGNARLLGVDCFVWVFLGFSAMAGFVLSQTQLGRWIYATGNDPEAARMCGIDIPAVRRGAFAFSGFAAGCAGVLLVSRTGTAISGSGLIDVLFPAVAAVVVGGTSIQGGRGAIWRTLCGILFLESIRNGFNLLEVDPYFQSISQGLIILLAIVADPASRRAA
jgi:ribose transport system permease protein